MGALGIDLALRRRGGAFDPASLFPGGTAGALYEVRPGLVFQDSAGTVAAGEGDPVGLLLDRSGNGHHAAQEAAAARPMLRRSASGNHYLEFDGIDDFLRTAAPPLPQPWERISALRQIGWGSNRHVFGGGGSNAGVLQQFAASANLRLFSGTGSAIANAAPVLGADEVVSERHDGAGSGIAVNEGAMVFADYGPLAAAGITIGASNSGASFSAIRLYGLLMRGGPLPVDARARARSWMAARAGIAV